MFWPTALALLLVVLYGLSAGWSAPRQWSDGFFMAAVAQAFFAVMMIMGTQGEATYASTMRYVDRGNITETLQQLILDTSRKINIGLRAFIGTLFTLLIAALVLWV